MAAACLRFPLDRRGVLLSEFEVGASARTGHPGFTMMKNRRPLVRSTRPVRDPGRRQRPPWKTQYRHPTRNTDTRSLERNKGRPVTCTAAPLANITNLQRME